MSTLKKGSGEPLIPVLFIGHGSPMNAIVENEYTLAFPMSFFRCSTPHREIPNWPKR